MLNGGRFDFDDGGTYCGGWEDGKAHGHGVCTGPKGQGEYSGAWHYGFEVSGVYMWPSGNNFEGQWQNGKRHGLGVERRGRWTYRGEWTQGYKGRYGVRHSTNSQAKYEGTWANGLQDGYGVETYADGGTYQGQWLRGMRHGYGIRKSAPYGVAAKYRSRSHAHASLTSLRSDQSEDGNEKDPKKTDESRGGFVLRARSEPPSRRRSLSERSVNVKRTILQGLRIKKQRSTGDIDQRVTGGGGTGSLRSSGSTVSCASDESGGTGFASSHDHGSFIGTEEFVDPNAVETYVGEWKNDKRSGFGVSERSDGLKYEGEWFNNKKYGYGVTTFKDGTKEEGKYKNNILVTSQKKRNLLFIRTSKLRERIDNAVGSAQRATQIALQKADIGMSRSGTAHERADQADVSSVQSREDAEIARIFAKQLSPDFNQNAFDSIKKPRLDLVNHIGTMQSARNYIGGNGLSSDGQHNLIPKSGHHPMMTMSSLDDATTTMSNSLSPDQTPPMITPPQEVPYRVQMAGMSGGGSVPLGLSNAINTPRFVLQSAQLQQQHPYIYQQQHSGGGGGPQQQLQSPLTMQQLQQQQQQIAAVQHQQQQMMQKQSSFEQGGGHQQLQQQQHPRPNVLSDRQQQTLQGRQQQQQQQQQQMMSNALDRQYHSVTGAQQHQQQQRGLQQQRSLDFVDADMYTHRTNKLSPTLSRSGSESSSRHSVNQMLNDFYDQYSTPGSKYRLKHQHTEDESPLSPGSGIIRRSTLGSARDCKKLQQQGFHYEPLEPSTSAAPPPASTAHHRPSTFQPQQHTSAMAMSHDAAIASASGYSGASGYNAASAHQPSRSKGPMVKQYSQHRDGSHEGARGSVPDLTELVKTPVQMTREEIARLSSQRRQELQRLNEDRELLHDNPLRYLRYLFHPSVKAWLVRWKLPLLVLLVNIGLSVIFCQLLTYSNLDKEDLDGNE